MFKGAKELPASATKDWHGDESEPPRYLKILSATALKSHLYKRTLSFILLFVGALTGLLPLFEARVASASLFGTLAAIYSLRWAKQLSLVLKLQQEADQGIKIVDRGPPDEGATAES